MTGTSENTALTGSCLCGRIRFRVAGPLGPALYCHCAQCRRATGSAFAAAARVQAKDFVLLAGRELIREFESSPGKLRAFCSNCGSPVYSRRPAEPEALRVRLGTLDGDPRCRPFAHIWVDAKAPWFDITDALPQHAENAPPAMPPPGA